MNAKKIRRERKRLIVAADVRDAATRLKHAADQCEKLASEMEGYSAAGPIEYDGGYSIIDAVSTAIEWEGFIRTAFVAKKTANAMRSRHDTAANLSAEKSGKSRGKR
jgi:hypothetical protein